MALSRDTYIIERDFSDVPLKDIEPLPPLITVYVDKDNSLQLENFMLKLGAGYIKRKTEVKI